MSHQTVYRTKNDHITNSQSSTKPISIPIDALSAVVVHGEAEVAFAADFAVLFEGFAFVDFWGADEFAAGFAVVEGA